MKQCLVLVLTLIALSSCQIKENNQGPEVRDSALIMGALDSLSSEILEENRKFWVHVPDQAMGDLQAKTTYPVLYLLDGPGHFHAVTGLLKNLGDNSIVPRMVVVGIPNTDRTRDLTPSHVDVMFGDSTFARTSGGGAHFLDFLEKELIPYVESKYPVTGYRTYVGHSFGGLAAVYALLDRPELFSNYVAIDPSLWWDDWLMVHWADSIIPTKNLDGKSLYIGVANTMEEGMELDQVLGDTSQSTSHIRSILTFINDAESGKNRGLNLGWKYYPDDDHGSVPLITEYDALRYLFPWYRLKGLDKFFQPESQLKADDLLKKLNDHYATVSDHFGYQVLPPEMQVNSLAYNFLNSGKTVLARTLFELNIKNYPGSINVYDSMGDYWLSQSDTLQAIEQFTKALEIGDSPVTRQKLEELVPGDQ